MTELKLLTPLKTEMFEFKNRVFMAPMTRARARPCGERTHCKLLRPTRHRFGLIISEGTQISERAIGWTNTPESTRPSRSRDGERSPGPCTTPGPHLRPTLAYRPRFSSRLPWRSLACRAVSCPSIARLSRPRGQSRPSRPGSHPRREEDPQYDSGLRGRRARQGRWFRWG